MDFMKSIEDVFGVFAVGIFTLLSLYTIIYGVAFCKIQSIKEFCKNLLPTTSNEDSNKGSKPEAPTKTPLCSGVIIAVAAIFIFGLGLIVQDIADKYTNTSVLNQKDPGIVVWLNNRCNILKNEYDLRFNTLLKKENGGFKLTTLGKDVFRHISFLRWPNKKNNPKFTKAQEDFLNDVSQKPNDYISEKFINDGTIIKDVISFAYYRAKNWAFSQPTYYDELKNLQIRVDFCRSILLISAITMVGLIGAFLISIVLMIIKNIRKNTSFKITRHLINIIILLVLLFFICCLSSTGYDNSERNFNERAMGYYVSFLDNYRLYYPGEELYKNEKREKKEKETTSEVTYNFPMER